MVGVQPEKTHDLRISVKVEESGQSIKTGRACKGKKHPKVCDLRDQKRNKKCIKSEKNMRKYEEFQTEV